VLLLDLYTAKKEIKRNKKSNELHQLGDEEQHDTEHVLAKNKNGVAIQCIIQSVPAIIPTLSVFNVILFIMECI
jgi:hypothetical protein